jgi:hypothetical protein
LITALYAQLLEFLGVIWPMDNPVKAPPGGEATPARSMLLLRRVWSAHIRIVVVVTILFSIGYLIYGGVHDKTKDDDTFFRGSGGVGDVGSEVEVIIGWIAVIAQIVSATLLLGPIMAWKVYAGNDAITDRFTRSVCYRTRVFFAISLGMMFILLIVFTLHIELNRGSQAIGEVELSLIISYGLLYPQAAAIFLITSDVRVCVHMIEYLIEGVKQQSLSFSWYQAVRQEIRYTSRFCQWLVAIVVTVAGLDGLVIIITSFLATENLAIISYFFAYCKEAVMLLFIIPEIIKVNDLADHLTVLLASEQWNEKTSSAETANAVGPIGTVSKHSSKPSSESERIAILLANLAEPISFDIFFTHISSKVLISTAIGCVVSLVIGVIKTFVDNSR